MRIGDWSSDVCSSDLGGFLLRRAHQHASEVFQSKIGNRNLTPQQFSVLVTLLERREIAQTRLGGLVAMDPATVLGVVQRLAQRGLVAVRPDPDDGRRRQLGRASCWDSVG